MAIRIILSSTFLCLFAATLVHSQNNFQYSQRKNFEHCSGTSCPGSSSAQPGPNYSPRHDERRNDKDQKGLTDEKPENFMNQRMHRINPHHHEKRLSRSSPNPNNRNPFYAGISGGTSSCPGGNCGKKSPGGGSVISRSPRNVRDTDKILHPQNPAISSLEMDVSIDTKSSEKNLSREETSGTRTFIRKRAYELLGEVERITRDAVVKLLLNSTKARTSNEEEEPRKLHNSSTIWDMKDSHSFSRDELEDPSVTKSGQEADDEYYDDDSSQPEEITSP